MNETDKKLIDHYYHALPPDDDSLVADLFLQDENEHDLEEIAALHWERSSTRKVDLRHILHRIHFLINSRSGRRPENRLLLFYSRIAAILFIPLLTAGIYLAGRTMNQENLVAEIHAPKGSRVQFTLPDGSKGYLNGGSALTYATDFTNERKVRLTGEGYFEVTKDNRHPFTVETEFADVIVLGTKFDVCAYGGDQEVVTTLEEGQVRVIDKKTNNSASLYPGEQSRINILTGEMLHHQVDTRLFTSWKEEMLRFDNAPFADVVKKMERWYGIRITLDKSLQYSDNYTLTIKTESLREMLQLLSLTTPMKYEIKEDNVFIYPLKTEKMTN
ncbi:MAG: FecR domain-containing protein [Prolixibacteraceae bacterium]